MKNINTAYRKSDAHDVVDNASKLDKKEREKSMNHINKTSPSRSVFRTWALHGLMAVLAIASAQANPNYSAGTAQALGLNASTITFQIGVPGEVDWYSLDFPASGTFTIQSLGSTDVEAELRLANGTTGLAWNDSGAGYPNFKITATVSAGRYYLIVRHHTGGTGPYSLRNTFNEFNNSYATAVKLDMNSYSRRFFLAAGDQDYYYVDVPSTGRLMVESQGSADTFCYLIDPTKQFRLDYNDNGAGYPNFRITADLCPGRYWLRVAQGSSSTGVYSLHTTFTPLNFPCP
jgi:hypothetical protein